MQLHVHDMLQPEALGLLARIRGLMDQYPGTVTLGEISSQPGAYERVRALHPGFAPPAHGLHAAAVARRVRRRVRRRPGARPRPAGDDGWTCWSFSNHDVERAVSRWNPRRGAAPPDPAFARLLMALLLSLRGSVCLYQGEELGLPEADLAEADLRDPFGIAYWPEFRGRDGSRTPMPWVAAERHGGFTTAATPWLPMPPAHRVLAADAQEADPDFAAARLSPLPALAARRAGLAPRLAAPGRAA